MNTFVGYEDFVDIFWGHHKIGLVLGVIFMYLGVFSYGKCAECGVFFFLGGGGGVQKFHFFFLGGGGA